MISKGLLALPLMLALAGCSLSKQEINSMDAASVYYCAVDGGAYKNGLWYKFDTTSYCRQRVAEMERTGQMLDSDKERALRAGAGL